MGKTLTREQRKDSKYISRKSERLQKYEDLAFTTSAPPKKEKPKKKWRPHSEIEID